MCMLIFFQSTTPQILWMFNDDNWLHDSNSLAVMSSVARCLSCNRETVDIIFGRALIRLAFLQATLELTIKQTKIVEYTAVYAASYLHAYI